MPGSATLPGLVAWIGAWRQRVETEATYLTELDGAIGDGDHGINLRRGLIAGDDALTAAVESGHLVAGDKALQQVAMSLISKIGGASGPLYGTMFLRMADGLGPELDTPEFARALRRGLDGLCARGKASSGDKTMIDALAPAVEAMESAASAGQTLRAALAQAAQAAAGGRDATKPLQARRGRASYLGERSIGHIDPGAASMALLIEAAAATLGA
ncbi:MAG: dihydroxyacetone kinase subunit L [Bifidobacteriaceae bacterium]|jgi:dihydroxyacetone kinase-like protein|nr:dihydroxyacetone kinase subunit L [Bifidobacteriaceae bacterium]